jgi:hypothetical protein
VIAHKTLQQWIWDMPSSEQDVGSLIEFGPLQAHLHWTVRDVYVDAQARTLIGRKCIVIETIEVEAEHRGKGWMRRMIHMLAVMCPVDFIVIGCVVNQQLARSLRGDYWSPMDVPGVESKDFAKTPRHILGF